MRGQFSKAIAVLTIAAAGWPASLMAQQCNSTPSCVPRYAAPNPAPPTPAAPAGNFVRGPATGQAAGESNSVGIRGFVLHFPEVRIGLPTLELPSLVRYRRNPEMLFDGTRGAFTDALVNELGILPDIAAPAPAPAGPTKAAPQPSCVPYYTPDCTAASLNERRLELELRKRELELAEMQLRVEELEQRNSGIAASPSKVDRSGRRAQSVSHDQQPAAANEDRDVEEALYDQPLSRNDSPEIRAGRENSSYAQSGKAGRAQLKVTATKPSVRQRLFGKSSDSVGRSTSVEPETTPTTQRNLDQTQVEAVYVSQKAVKKRILRDR